MVRLGRLVEEGGYQRDGIGRARSAAFSFRALSIGYSATKRYPIPGTEWM